MIHFLSETKAVAGAARVPCPGVAAAQSLHSAKAVCPSWGFWTPLGTSPGGFISPGAPTVTRGCRGGTAGTARAAAGKLSWHGQAGLGTLWAPPHGTATPGMGDELWDSTLSCVLGHTGALRAPWPHSCVSQQSCPLSPAPWTSCTAALARLDRISVPVITDFLAISKHGGQPAHPPPIALECTAN